MSNHPYASSKRYVERVEDDGTIIFSPTIFGLVCDDYDEMEVYDFDSADPLGNVKKAYEIAEKIKAEIRAGTGIYSVRDWYDRHRDDPDFDEHYWMRED